MGLAWSDTSPPPSSALTLGGDVTKKMFQAMIGHRDWCTLSVCGLVCRRWHLWVDQAISAWLRSDGSARIRTIVFQNVCLETALRKVDPSAAAAAPVPSSYGSPWIVATPLGVGGFGSCFSMAGTSSLCVKVATGGLGTRQLETDKTPYSASVVSPTENFFTRLCMTISSGELMAMTCSDDDVKRVVAQDFLLALDAQECAFLHILSLSVPQYVDVSTMKQLVDDSRLYRHWDRGDVSYSVSVKDGKARIVFQSLFECYSGWERLHGRTLDGHLMEVSYVKEQRPSSPQAETRLQSLFPRAVDFGMNAGIPFFIMERVPGITLREVLRYTFPATQGNARRPILPGEVFVEVDLRPCLIKVMDAFVRVPSFRHCDLKPENILLEYRNDMESKEEEKVALKLIDRAPIPRFGTNQMNFYLNEKGDASSFAAIIIELCTGEPLERRMPQFLKHDLNILLNAALARLKTHKSALVRAIVRLPLQTNFIDIAKVRDVLARHKNHPLMVRFPPNLCI